MISSPSPRFVVSLALLALAPSAPPRASAQPPQRRPTPNDTLKSTEVAPDHKVTFRIYAPKATRSPSAATSARAARWTKDDKGVWSLTVGPLDARLLQLHVHRRRRPHRRPEEPDDQAGHLQPGQHVPRARRGGRVRGDQGRPARRGPRRAGIARDARHAAADARLHAAGLRGGRRQVPGPLPAARRRATRTRAGAPSAGPASSSTT